MARFNVYVNPHSSGYLLDVQADVHSHFNTRMVVPLLPIDHAPKPANILNPLFSIVGEQHVMMTQFMAAVPVKVLQSAAFSVSDRHNEIVAALDLLLHGF